MRKITYLLSILLYILSSLTIDANAREKFGIIIANSEYRNAEPLAFSKNDYIAARHLFVDVLHVDPDNILGRADNVTFADMLRIFGGKGIPIKDTFIYQHMNNARKDAELYVYIILHGISSPVSGGGTDAYFLLKDSLPEGSALASTAYSRQLLVDQLKRLRDAKFPEGRITLFIESCFSGYADSLKGGRHALVQGVSAAGFGPPELVRPDHFRVITATKPHQFAVWDKQFKQSVFTKALVMGYYGAADLNDNNAITAREMKEYLLSAVRRGAMRNKGFSQEPQMVGFNPGDVLANLDDVRMWPKVKSWINAEKELFRNRFNDSEDSEQGESVRENVAYSKAVSLGTVEAYDDFLKKYPYSPKAKRIRLLLNSLADDTAWKRAQKEGSLSAYKRYLLAFEDGLHIEEAKLKMQEIKSALERDEKSWSKALSCVENVSLSSSACDRIEKQMFCAETYRKSNMFRGKHDQEAVQALEQLRTELKNCQKNDKDKGSSSSDIEVIKEENSIDGVYRGRRGYYRVRRPYCLGIYNFEATISNGTIVFYSDGRRWSGTVSDSGYIHIDNSGVSPPTKYGVEISGHISNGELYSGYCGRGFFRLSKR